MVSIYLDYISFCIIVLFYLCGFICALNSLFQARTPQGTMAWVIALLCVPFLAIPIFLIFGKKRIEKIESIDREAIPYQQKIKTGLESFNVYKAETSIEKFFTYNDLNFLKGHELELLLDGKETFDEMLRTIRSANKYILLQMYILRTDHIGQLFADALIEKSKQGVEVYVLYESLGIYMSKTILKKMEAAGVKLGEFTPLKFNKLQANFRNHRKLLIVDGNSGFFGGINIGDDYLGRYSSIGHWRDTNIKVIGPIVNQAQIGFIEDWQFSQKIEIKLKLQSPLLSGQSNALLINTGPDEERAFNLLQHVEIINSATERLWLANPYLVPPQSIMDALLIAVMHGVDVRILVPEKSDNFFVALAAEVYLDRLVKAGVKVYKYCKGMMHQKIVILDNSIAMIGSSNLDFRSMYINFENSIVTDDAELIKDLAFSFKKDLDLSTEVKIFDFRDQSFIKKLSSHVANSIAPVL